VKEWAAVASGNVTAVSVAGIIDFLLKVAKFIVPDCGDKVNSGCSTGLPGYIDWQAGTNIPQSWTKNLAADNNNNDNNNKNNNNNN
jgi:hypothetical protein